MAYEWERDAWRSAGRDRGQATCYRHDYRPNRNGGGTCTTCGDTIDTEEL